MKKFNKVKKMFDLKELSMFEILINLLSFEEILKISENTITEKEIQEIKLKLNFVKENLEVFKKLNFLIKSDYSEIIELFDNTHFENINEFNFFINQLIENFKIFNEIDLILLKKRIIEGNY